MSINVEQTIREYLPGIIHMSLATASNDQPWVCEVHYAYDEDLNLYYRSLSSRRHSQEIAANPKVAGNVVRQHQAGEYPLGVYFEGTAKHLEVGSKEQQAAFKALNARFQSGEKIVEEAKNPEGHQFYKVTVETWYVFGKLADEASGQKYPLPWHGGKK